MNILIADDCKEDRELYKEYLKQFTLIDTTTIHQAINLTTTIERIKNNNYDVIILDLGLPESDGIDTIKKVLSSLKEYDKNTPIVVLTGLDNYTIGKEAFELGITDFLIKNETHSKQLIRAITYATYAKAKNKEISSL